MIVENIEFFIFAFTSIFVIVDPISGAVTFVSMTSKMTNEEKNKIAKKAVMLACAIALFFAISGGIVLDLFKINIDSLRIAGGILLFGIAFDMMHAKISRESITEEEISHSQEREDIWIFPIGLPLLTGPGTISTVIVLVGGTGSFVQKIIILVSIILTFILSLYVFLFSRRINKLVGYNGMLVFTRVMGLLLAALAVNLTVTGITNMFRITI